MNRTSIEWAQNPDGSQGYTWNPITGCLNHDNGLCNGGGFPCYAYKLANGRLKQRYLANTTTAMSVRADGLALNLMDRQVRAEADPFYPRFWEEKLSQPIGYATTNQVDGILAAKPPKGKGIFVCDMSDLFGIGIPEEWTGKVLRIIEHTSYNRFYLLTKQPGQLIKFSPFPDNAWVGMTLTNSHYANNARQFLLSVKAKVKFLSLEPLLAHMDGWALGNAITHADWLIIGAWTGSIEDKYRFRDKYPDLQAMEYGHKLTLQPKIEWVREIVEAADRAGIPVFLKNNLQPLLNQHRAGDWQWAVSPNGKLRQEMPQGGT